ATLRIRKVGACGEDVVTAATGSMGPKDIFLAFAGIREWHISGAALANMTLVGTGATWTVAPSSCGCVSILRWVGSALDRDLSANGQAEATFLGGGMLTITGRVYAGASPPPGATPLFNG